MIRMWTSTVQRTTETKKDEADGKSWNDRARESRKYEEGIINREKATKDTNQLKDEWGMGDLHGFSDF